MSFILEALKKSARERERGEIPSLEANHQAEYDLHFSKPNRQPKLKWIIFSLSVFLPLLLIAVWFGQNLFNPKGEQAVTVSQVTDQPPKPSQQPEETTVPAQDIIQNPKPVQTPSKVEKIIKKNDSISTTITEPVEPKISTPATDNDKAGDGHHILEEAGQNLPPLLKYLPEEIRNNIPEIKFAGHAYSDDPGQRMIIINQKIVRENDVVEPKLILETIMPNGIILNYDSTRFRLEIFK